MTTNPANAPWDTIFVLPGAPGAEASSQVRDFESSDVALVSADHGFDAALGSGPEVVIYTGLTTPRALQAIANLALTGHRVIAVTDQAFPEFCAAVSALADPTALDVAPITGDDVFALLP